MTRKLNQAQITEIIARYQGGETMTRIAQDYDVTRLAVRLQLIKNGIVLTPFDHHAAATQYTLNERYFDSVSTEEQAYWLGFLAADGYISVNRRYDAKSLVVNLAEGDIERLYALKEALDATHPVFTYPKPRGQRAVRLSMRSNILAAGLAQYGIVNRKTYTIRMPYLDAALIPHFLRGYSDGDGGFYEYPNRRIKWTITSNANFVEDVRIYLSGILQTGGNVYRDPKNPQMAQFTR